MNENLPIEAINLNLEGMYSDSYVLVYRAYLKNSGCTDWIYSGENLGEPDSGNPIQTIQVKLEGLENS